MIALKRSEYYLMQYLQKYEPFTISKCSKGIFIKSLYLFDSSELAILLELELQENILCNVNNGNNYQLAV